MTTIAEQVGRVVGGRYRLLAPVGAGASSQVFAASDTRLSRRVAVKLLHPMLAGDNVFLRRFRAEARLAASLDHPHVMRVFDWGEEQEGPYLVLEYLGGGSLREMLDTGILLDHSQAASVGAQAASGLAYAHRRGIVHRDIKPSNILFDDEGHLRIGDFGVARALAESALTEPLGAIFGTARYASPEQAEGRLLDDRTDVYSLALVLFEALTGRVPFTADTIASTLMARVGATLPIASELGPLAAILAQAAISEPLARLDATALCSDLELLVRELPPASPLPLVRISLEAQWTVSRDRDPTSQDTSQSRFGAEPAPYDDLHDYLHDDLHGDPRGDLHGDPREPRVLTEIAPVEPASSKATRHERKLAKQAQRQIRRSQSHEASSATVARRKRRWVRPVAWVLAVLVLLGAAAGGTAAYLRYKLYDHIVPRLTGLSLPQAEADAHRVGLKAAPTSKEWDARVRSGLVISQSLKIGHKEKAGTSIGLVISKGAEPVAVPDLSKDGLKAAKAALLKAHFKVGSTPSVYSSTVQVGYVLTWSDKGKSEVPGTAINITWSKGHRPVQVPPIPTTDTYDEAASALEAAGFVAVRAPQYTMSVPINYVIQTAPSGLRPYGSSVTVTISLGPPFVTVPKLYRDSAGQAATALTKVGLQISEHRGFGGDTVSVQIPSANSSVREGTVVNVFLLPIYLFP